MGAYVQMWNQLISLVLVFFQLCACNSMEALHLRRLGSLPSAELSISEQRRLVGFGLYAEVPESCPAMTTCPILCVNDTSLCPFNCTEGFNLCYDGSCSPDPCDESLPSPCECETMLGACPYINDYYDECMVNFDDFYKEYDFCLLEQELSLPRVSFTSFWFLFCYFWISGLTVIVFIWCNCNSVQFEPKSLIPSSEVNDQNEWTQTGYKDHWMGLIILSLVWITLVGIHVILLILTLFYYMQQEVIVRWKPVFLDDVQALLAFIITWNVGFFWSMMFMWPETVASVFRRRCKLCDASYISVVAAVKQVQTIGNQEKPFFSRIIRWIRCPINATLQIFFSMPLAPPGFERIWCKVDRKVLSFNCRMGRYVYSEIDEKFIPGSIEVGRTIGDFYHLRNGLTTEEASQNLQIVGLNVLQIKSPSIIRCLWEEFTKVFYLYQTFILWTWFNFYYYHMGILETFVRLTVGTVTAIHQYMSDCVLFQLTSFEGSTEVIRDGTRFSLQAQEIVPGDVLVLAPGVVHCDLVVLESQYLLVDESALTGESNPVLKVSLNGYPEKTIYDDVTHRHHTIFAGTTILEVGEDNLNLGLVLATGSSTKKGQLLTDILSYKRVKFLFDHEVDIVILILVLQAFALVTTVFQFLNDQRVYAWFYGMFVVATVIPPLLPTVFIVSVGISASRLRKIKISCTQPEALLVAGKVNYCCFDKTGTLTETSMNCTGVNCYNDDLKVVANLGMAVCHNLRTTQNDEIVGQEVDKALFLASGASMQNSESGLLEITLSQKIYKVIRQFTFNHHSTTQSVVVETDGIQTVFVKGSPEAVIARCRPETVPKSLAEDLHAQARAGKYLLAIAYKTCDFDTKKSDNSAEGLESAVKDMSTLTREEIEVSLSFCGFITFENRLKAETQNAMTHLHEANVSICMVTGDNVHTGIRIAREAGICKSDEMFLGEVNSNKTIQWINVDTNDLLDNQVITKQSAELALTGEAWTLLLHEDKALAQSIQKNVRVFGRCNPADKVSVVTSLVESGCITLMCGDGQNDCGALKSANIGISLSSSEASIVSPFTSLNKSVTAVVDVMKEGRCALSSALKVYSYFILYGQLCSMLQVICTYFSTTFGDWSWVFLDGVWPITFSFVLPLTKAAKKLSIYRPTASLFGARTLCSICGLLFWNIFFIILSLFLLFKEDWFQCRMWTGENVSAEFSLCDNYETSILFIVGGFQFITTAFALSFGYSWRGGWYTNIWFVVVFLGFAVSHIIMTMHPSGLSCFWRINCSNENVVPGFGSSVLVPINNPFNTTVIPLHFRYTLLIIMFVNFITLCAWEYFFVNGILYKFFKFD